jgi:Pvc16 N-terminal domain
MSSALAIAGVTQILRDLLNEGIIDGDVAAAVGAAVAVRALPPDRLQSVATPDSPLLNLFLHRVTRNTGWSNVQLPSRAPDGRLTTNPPLALDLHYLLSAYGFDELHGEILLGYALQILHEHPAIGRAQIQTALAPPAGIGGGLPPALQALDRTELADQIEQLRITPDQLSTEEMSRIWTALQTHYRPSVGFQVTVILIERRRPTRAALPVLRVGPDARGPTVFPEVAPPLPQITGIELPVRQPSARLGETITVRGRHLDGTGIGAVVRNARLIAPLALAPAAPPAPSARAIRFDIPNDAAAWIAGPLSLEVEVQKPGEPAPRRTNAWPLLLAPRADFAGAAVARVGDFVVVDVDVAPEVRAGQIVSMAAGSAEAPAEPFAGAATSQLTFRFPGLPAGVYPARLRVDGVDSWLILRDQAPVGPDFEPVPPAFDPTQQITAPA